MAVYLNGLNGVLVKNHVEGQSSTEQEFATIHPLQTGAQNVLKACLKLKWNVSCLVQVCKTMICFFLSKGILYRLCPKTRVITFALSRTRVKIFWQSKNHSH